MRYPWSVTPHHPNLQHYWSLPIRLFNVISTEMQSAYSTTQSTGLREKEREREKEWVSECEKEREREWERESEWVSEWERESERERERVSEWVRERKRERERERERDTQSERYVDYIFESYHQVEFWVKERRKKLHGLRCGWYDCLTRIILFSLKTAV